ncbi:hypothetical protein PAPHI01_1877 [Pancytospora philotis]|nr:hypothetical protein PAPHI01_1877 [Pancytospora philotis]
MTLEHSIVQMPLGLARADLPEHITLDVPFTIDGRQYVMARGQPGDLKVCEEVEDVDGASTSLPRPCRDYYIISQM